MTQRARMGVPEIEQQVSDALKRLRRSVKPASDSAQDMDIATLECFAQVAFALMRKTNASKVRECAMVFEIKARMDIAGVQEAA